MKNYKGLEITTYGTNLKIHSVTLPNGISKSSSSWDNLKKQINKFFKSA